MISASARRLSVFKSVVDSGGFNAAATALNIAQPSVGAHVKALESQLGQPLFHRHRGSRPRLTKAGETLYAYAADMLKKSEETTQVLTDLRKHNAREIAIAVHRDLAAHYLPSRLASFTAKFPKTRVVTRIGTIEDVVDLARQHVVNLGIFLASGPVSGIHSEVLDHEPLLMVASPAHPLAHRPSVSPQDIGQYPFVPGLRSSRYFQLVMAALASAGITPGEIALELQESSAVKEVLRHGTGIACLPASNVATEIAAGSLAVLPLRVPPPALELRCAYHAPPADIVREFVAHIRKKLL